MKVWIVYSEEGCCDDRSFDIEGVFSTREKANAFALQFGDDLNIGEWELDNAKPFLEHAVHIDRHGNITEEHVIKHLPHEHGYRKEGCRTRWNGRGWTHTGVSVKSRERALELAHRALAKHDDFALTGKVPDFMEWD